MDTSREGCPTDPLRDQTIGHEGAEPSGSQSLVNYGSVHNQALRSDSRLVIGKESRFYASVGIRVGMADGSVTGFRVRRAPSFGWWDFGFLGISLVMWPVIAGMFYYLAIGGWPGGLKGAVVASAATVAGVFLLVESITLVRSVEIGSDGVRFRYLFHSEFGRWSDLQPGGLPVQHGEWFVVRRRYTTSRLPILRVKLRGHRLTVSMARAVLSSPYCPPMDLPESVRTILLPLTARSA
jgi:hypothetical protein